jgi:hypothetical protein
VTGNAGFGPQAAATTPGFAGSLTAAHPSFSIGTMAARRGAPPFFTNDGGPPSPSSSPATKDTAAAASSTYGRRMGGHRPPPEPPARLLEPSRAGALLLQHLTTGLRPAAGGASRPTRGRAQAKKGREGKNRGPAAPTPSRSAGGGSPPAQASPAPPPGHHPPASGTGWGAAAVRGKP